MKRKGSDLSKEPWQPGESPGAGTPRSFEVGNLIPGRGLEKLATKALSDPDPELATNAAVYLERHGSPAARGEVWDRYVRWSTEWKGRDAELRFTPMGPASHTWDANLGKELATALFRAAGWYVTEDEIRRVKAMATQEIASQLDGVLYQAAQRPIQIDYSGTDSFLRVAQYDLNSLAELKAKLNQYPRQSVFVLLNASRIDPKLVADFLAWAKGENLNVLASIQ